MLQDFKSHCKEGTSKARLPGKPYSLSGKELKMASSNRRLIGYWPARSWMAGDLAGP